MANYVLSKVDVERRPADVMIIQLREGESADAAHHTHQQSVRAFWSPFLKVGGGAYQAHETWTDALIEAAKPFWQ